MRSIYHPLVATSDMTCGACPEQHEGTLVTGEGFYFRYRYGHASLKLDGAEPNYTVMEYGDGYAGVFQSPEVREWVFQVLLTGIGSDRLAQAGGYTWEALSKQPGLSPEAKAALDRRKDAST